jgi:amino acid transporter
MARVRDAGHAEPGAAGPAADAVIRKDALAGAGVNALINAAISGFLLAGKGPQVLSVDSIASTEHTVLGSAVTLAVSLAFILATITFFTFRKKAAGQAAKALLERPYFFFGLRQALGGALFMFGTVVALAVLWQRFFGTLTVSTPVAAAIAGLVFRTERHVNIGHGIFTCRGQETPTVRAYRGRSA